MTTHTAPWWKPTPQTRSLLGDMWFHAPLCAAAIACVYLLDGARQIAEAVAIVVGAVALSLVVNAGYAQARRVPLAPSTARWLAIWIASSLAALSVSLIVAGEPGPPMLAAGLCLAALPAEAALRRLAGQPLDSPS